MLVIYVCHDQQSVDHCNKRYPDSHIVLVGPKDAISKFPERLIIARNLKDNIEHERKLLTFTAWYAIVKNNLFPESDIMCILEWDAVLVNSIPEIRQDIGILKTDPGYNFFTDIRPDVLVNYLMSKQLPVNRPGEEWACTTNFILRRHVIEKFVDLYYPSSILEIKQQDFRKLSWYHERVFSMFIRTRNFTTIKLPIITHYQSNSHLEFNALSYEQTHK
jgi:hypothetical protein